MTNVYMYTYILGMEGVKSQCHTFTINIIQFDCYFLSSFVKILLIPLISCIYISKAWQSPGRSRSGSFCTCICYIYKEVFYFSNNTHQLEISLLSNKQCWLYGRRDDISLGKNKCIKESWSSGLVLQGDSCKEVALLRDSLTSPLLTF